MNGKPIASAAIADGDAELESVPDYFAAELYADDAPNGTTAHPGLVTLADVAPERVSWLWPGRIPRGKVTVIDGDPSTGKSTLSLDVAARVSTGADWPDGAPGAAPAGVLLLSAEDGPGDTIRPRLDAAGADPSRVHLLEGVPHTDEEGTVRLVFPSVPRDVDHIEKVVRRHQVQLAVIDVLVAYLSGDSHKDQEVRGALAPLAAMAERTGCAVIVIRHLNKSGGSNALYRGGGSIGIIGAARAAFIVARDGEDPARRILACSKMNLAVEPPALAYRLASDGPSGVARVEWEPDALDGVTAASLLRVIPDEDERTERDEAAEWLAGFLFDNGGDALAADVRRASAAVGMSWRTVQRARERAGVESVKAAFKGGWLWRLRAEDAMKKPKNHTPEVLASSAPSVAPSADPTTCPPVAEPLAEADPSVRSRYGPPIKNPCPECGESLDGPGAKAKCRPNHHPKGAAT